MYESLCTFYTLNVKFLDIKITYLLKRIEICLPHNVKNYKNVYL